MSAYFATMGRGNLPVNRKKSLAEPDSWRGSHLQKPTEGEGKEKT